MLTGFDHLTYMPNLTTFLLAILLLHFATPPYCLDCPFSQEICMRDNDIHNLPKQLKQNEQTFHDVTLFLQIIS